MTQPHLGERLRALRKAKEYTLEQVAILSGLSKSFISMLENGQTNISASKLDRLTSLFGLRASDVLSDASGSPLIQVVREGQGPAIKGFEGEVKAFLLSKDLYRRIQPVLLHLAITAKHENSRGHPGEEFIYILKGDIKLTVDKDQVVMLSQGDSAYYPSSLSHCYENTGPEEAQLITISTPPKLI